MKWPALPRRSGATAVRRTVAPGDAGYCVRGAARGVGRWASGTGWRTGQMGGKSTGDLRADNPGSHSSGPSYTNTTACAQFHAASHAGSPPCRHRPRRRHTALGTRGQHRPPSSSGRRPIAVNTAPAEHSPGHCRTDATVAEPLVRAALCHSPTVNSSGEWSGAELCTLYTV